MAVERHLRPFDARRSGRWMPKVALVACDLVFIVLALAAAYALRTLASERGVVVGTDHLKVAVLSLPIWVGFFRHYRLYSTRHVGTAMVEFGRIIHAAGASVVAMAVIGFMGQFFVYRGWLVLTFCCAVVLVCLERAAVRVWFDVMRRRGRFLRPVAIVGGNPEALGMADMLTKSPELGYRVVGFVANLSGERDDVAGYPFLGRIDEALDAVRAAGAGGVVVATTAVDSATSNRLTRKLTDAGIHVELSSSLQDIAPQRLTVRSLGRCPVVYVEPVLRSGWRAAAKRAFDVAFSAVALVALSPLLAVVAVAVKLDSPGPVLFRQIRVGQHGDPFWVLKFRTMVTDAEARLIDLRSSNEADGPLFKMKEDPRVTRLGRWLRRTSIDELPQFANVLRGQMSVVGPRPALPMEVDAWHPELYQRLWVKPGVTGNWQVHGRSSANFEDYVRLDLYYVDNWSLWADLSLVLQTVPALLSRRGAY